MLLRLADILDFDNSRSPKSVYELLDLGNPKNHSEEISRNEWHKHMASRGFQFPATPDGLPLNFRAAPKHPFIEQNIRVFLDVIDEELAAAVNVSRLCSKKWAGFPLPSKIDRTNIVSNNYVSGKFRFALAEDKILDLLTGDSLYDDNFVFIRELLQNAIDTVRHRSFIERMRGAAYQSQPIFVSFFKDEQGYFWLRMDDEGMGMNRHIIENYLLNKGNSYYLSDDFKLQKIEIKNAETADFEPISRFGIGLLSCFMSCDKIEINTCYYYHQPGRERQRTRLSIEGRAGYWVIQSEQLHHVPGKMPAAEKWEDGYRPSVGTSIACRLKTSREFRGLDMESQVDRFLLAPEVPVLFHGKQVGGDRKEMTLEPWCKHSYTPLPEKFVQECSAFLGVQVESIVIEILPIDLTTMAASNNLTGQMVLVAPAITLKSPPKGFRLIDHFKVREQGDLTVFVCEKREKDAQGREIPMQITENISKILEAVRIPKKFLEYVGRHNAFIFPRVSHNGITTHDNDHQLQPRLSVLGETDIVFMDRERNCLVTGLFCFRDSLLPELAVSRSYIKQFTPEMIGHIYYATRQLNEYAKANGQPFSYFPDLERGARRRDVEYTVAILQKMGLWEKDPDFWMRLPCMVTRESLLSLGEAIILAKEGALQFEVPIFQCAFYAAFAKYMIIKHFFVRYIPENKGYYLEGRLAKHPIEIPTHLLDFQPLQFVEGVETHQITLLNGSLNLEHPLIRWYLTHAALIKREWSNYGIQFIDLLQRDGKVASKLAAINEILGRLRELLPAGSRPPADLILRESDLDKHHNHNA